MKLFDTAKNDYVELKIDDIFRMYVCGITPYDSAHLGHIFTFMTYDLLQRRIEDMGHEVRMVRNITDVDEPIYKKAEELDIHYSELADAETASFNEVIKQLNFRPLYAEPKASQYIEEMAVAVKELLEKGFGYYVDKDIYFDTSKFDRFGEFSGYSDRLLLAFMRDRGGDPERPGKRSPLDFLLWRHVSDPKDPAQWQTVAGNGRPGWHIECSVMSSKLLGLPFDLHGGGTDLIFPHHECEIAQSFGLNGQNPAKLWVHVSPMLSAGEKMSKSLGNLIFAKDLLKDYEPAVLRLALMHYHHRIGGEWQPELLLEAEKLLKSFRQSMARADKQASYRFLEKVRASIDDDINTLEVVDAMHNFINDDNNESRPVTVAKVNCNKVCDLIGLK
jgi:L-cysteine:1D-myo-inositol 2-amino-2-deoxy-alpha-D-glucopyranoside ligase